MSDVNRWNGVKIIVESTSREYHSYDNWGLYVTNTDCIGEPVLYKKYIEVPGRTGMIDLSEVLSGRQVYISREIKIELAGIRNKILWDGVISSFRNNINGKICRIIFDNDPEHYWRGRVEIVDFSSVLTLGRFQISIPDADPYKYDVRSSTEPWLWDPFNFETGVITQIGAVTITGTGSITIPRGHMPTTPQIVVSDMISGTFTVTYDGSTFSLATGTNIIPSIMVGGDDEVELEFTGSATVQIVYRGGSL